jgi:large conductance mechanosensitive channel
MGLIREFKEFALRGNVVDLAVGIIIGAAFTALVNSLVKDVIMPPIGMLISGVDFTQMKVVLKAASDGRPEVALTYGVFINALITFLLVALAVFLLVKGINTLRRRLLAKPAPAAEEPPPALTTDQRLLTEIRDLLKK